MGKKRHHRGSNNAQDRKRRRDAEEKWRSVRGDEQQNHRPNVWNTEPFENKRFEAFYNAQYFLNDEEDSKAFIGSLTSTLPTCFRLYTDSPFIDELRQELVQFIEKYHQLKQQQPPTTGEETKPTAENEEEKLPLEQISWYPNGSGYKLSLDKRSIRKRPELADLHKWMVLHTENGNITRQEAVSMVPPVALDVKPHHKCLDLCAAPGSKTSQLLEVINRSLTQPSEEQGIVVANDADTDRAYMLVHQCRRINSPLLVVTTHQGQNFPTIASDPLAFQEKRGSKSGMEFFDRVLCDVPCSGDGTLRKNPTIWSKWNTSMGAVMHPLQLMISKRGLQLTKKGGLMVYSTCSLSPYENESVVAELLRANKGKLELVDAREFLPLFKARKGLSKWNVLDDHFAARKESQAKREAKQKQQQLKQQQQQQSEVKEEGASEPMAVEGADDTNVAPTSDVVDNADTTEKAVEDFSHIEDPKLRKCLEMGMLHFPSFEDVPNGVKWKYRQSLFPPTAEEAEWMHLERCLRCVPHDEDTGGFFVATLRKIDDSATSSSNQKEEEVVAQPAEAVVSEEEAKATAEAVALANALDQGEGGGKGNQRGGRDNKKQRADNAMVKYHLWDEVSFQQMKEYYKFDDTITEKSFYVREDTALTRGKATAPTAKTVYFFPSTVQSLLQGDVTQQLKIVTSGVKAFEKKAISAAAAAAAAAEGNNGNNVTKDYRLLQECLPFLNRNIHARKVSVTIQDFSNLLEGGLVSYSTLSPQTLQSLTALTAGIVICTYHYKPSDVVSATEVAVKEGDYDFSMVCWKGSSACLNVMCSKIDLQSFKHQLNALHVLRSKIVAIKKFAGTSTSADVKEGEGEDDIGAFEEVAEEAENKDEEDDNEDDEAEEEDLIEEN